MTAIFSSQEGGNLTGSKSPIKITYENKKEEVMMKTDKFEICQIHVSDRAVGVIGRKRWKVYAHFDGKEYHIIEL